MDVIPVEKLIKTFMKIRERREKLSADFKAVDEDLKEKQEKIKQALLDYCKETGQDGGKVAGVGSFSRSIKKKFWTSDWDAMYRFVIEHEVPEFFNKQLNQSNVQAFLDDNPDIFPPGLNIDSEFVITISKPRGKG